MKVIFNGSVFNPTGSAKYHRNVISALKDKGVQVHVTHDYYDEDYDPKGNLKDCFTPISKTDNKAITFHVFHPSNSWFGGSQRRIALPVHEGSRLPPGWAEGINATVEKIFVPSKATKNLYFSSGVRVPIFVTGEGADKELYTPEGTVAEIIPPENTHLKDPFIFLYVGSWEPYDNNGNIKFNDRKGVIDLLHAFCNEFGPEENVLLYLKLNTPWRQKYDPTEYIKKLIPKKKLRTIVPDDMSIPEKWMPNLYRAAHCYVTATRGESWGLTICEAAACGLPVICMRNKDAGYMDFLDDKAYFYEPGERVQADPDWFCEGNLMPANNLKSLQETMRKVFETDRGELKKKGLELSKYVRENHDWSCVADRMISALKR